MFDRPSSVALLEMRVKRLREPEVTVARAQ